MPHTTVAQRNNAKRANGIMMNLFGISEYFVIPGSAQRRPGIQRFLLDRLLNSGFYALWVYVGMTSAK
jgi:hypothetical protein